MLKRKGIRKWSVEMVLPACDFLYTPCETVVYSKEYIYILSSSLSCTELPKPLGFPE